MIEYINNVVCSDEINDDAKNILLDILERVVREECSDNPDGLFKSLLSSESEKNQQELLGEQEKLKQEATNAFERNSLLLEVKDSNFQRLKNLKAMNERVCTPEKVTEKLPPGSAPTVVARSLTGNDVADASKTLIFDNSQTEVLDSSQTEVIDNYNTNSDVLSVPMDTSSFDSPIRNETAIARTSFDSGQSSNPSPLKKPRYTKDTISFSRKRKGGTSHKSVTRRKNKKSSKRKTIRRKIPKRKNKTLRNK
jgi:hypothetical protein